MENMAAELRKRVGSHVDFYEDKQLSVMLTPELWLQAQTNGLLFFCQFLHRTAQG